jgi:hypothetical protein
VTSGGTEIVRYFGRELEVKVPAKVAILRKSCFEGCNQLERIEFEEDSKLVHIGRSALSNCETLKEILIPASVEVIEEGAFKGCIGLESCITGENAKLVTIEKSAFSECLSLRLFYVAASVSVMGENCFHKCNSLRRLRFATSESLKTLVFDSTLDEMLEKIGLADFSMLLRIEMEHSSGGADCEFSGWSSVGDGRSHLALVQDIS